MAVELLLLCKAILIVLSPLRPIIVTDAHTLTTNQFLPCVGQKEQWRRRLNGFKVSGFKAAEVCCLPQSLVCSQKHSPLRLILAPLHGSRQLEGVGCA
jgi:hypothetical protein